MPMETKQAIDWALNQTYENEFGEKEKVENDNQMIVDYVRKYFNDNNIEYDTFSFKDLEPLLN